VVDDHLRDLLSEQNRAIFWKHFNANTSANNASGLAVRSRAHAISSTVGAKNTCSTRAEVNRLNCE
jgi:hypothetical protein